MTSLRHRDLAARCCGCRASDEASGRIHTGGRVNRTDKLVFTHESFPPAARDLAWRCFQRIFTAGRSPAENWAEAEAMIRLGWPEKAQL